MSIRNPCLYTSSCAARCHHGALHAQHAHAAHLVEVRHAHCLVTIRGNRPALAAQLRALPWIDRLVPHRGKGRALPARMSVAPLPGEGPRPVRPGSAGGRLRPAGGRVAVFPTSAFMELKASVRIFARHMPRCGAAISRCSGVERRTRL